MNDEEKVIYWNNKLGKLEGNVRAKIRKYCREKKVQRIDDYTFELLPLAGNKLKHTVSFVQTKSYLGYACTCQQFGSKGECSHTKTVEYFVSCVENGITQRGI